MHRPIVEPAFRRGSFGIEVGLNMDGPSNDAAEQFRESLNHSERPAPSRRSSPRAGRTAFVPPPPPLPPSVVDSMHMRSHRSISLPSLSPALDLSSGINSRKTRHSPIRPSPLSSSIPRQNSSQAEYFIHSSSSLLPPSSQQAHSFAREQVADEPINIPPRTGWGFQTQDAPPHLESYSSAPRSLAGDSGFVTSDSGEVSDAEEEGLARRIKTKALGTAKSQVARKQSGEGGALKTMQEQTRQTKHHATATHDNHKPELAIVAPKPRPATTALTVNETFSGRVHFKSDKPSAEDLPSPTPPRVPTHRPAEIWIPARVRSLSSNPKFPGRAADDPSVHEVWGNNILRKAVPPAHETPTPFTTKISPVFPQLTPRPKGKSPDAGPDGAETERSKLGFMPWPPFNAPRAKTSLPPIDTPLAQQSSPLSTKTPRTTSFDPAQNGPLPGTNDKPSLPPLAPRAYMYLTPNQARARTESAPVGSSVRREKSTRRRVDSVVGTSTTTAAGQTFDQGGSKKRTKEVDLRAQEKRRTAEELLARELRLAQKRKLREEQRAEETRRSEAAEHREREEWARYEQRKKESERRKSPRAANPSYEHTSPTQSICERSALDAWDQYELRWSALSVGSSNQPIGFQDIPWPLSFIPTSPESITPQTVGAFILSPLHSQDKSREERLRNAGLLWHSDGFEGRWMTRVAEDERPKVREIVKRVHMSLATLMRDEVSNGKLPGVFTTIPQESTSKQNTSDAISAHTEVAQSGGSSCKIPDFPNLSSESRPELEDSDNRGPSSPMGQSNLGSPDVDSTEPGMDDNCNLEGKAHNERTSQVGENEPKVELISRQMSVSEVVSHLVGHGCQDLTSAMDHSTFSEYAISKGGFSDVHSARLKDTTQVAVKILRMSISSLAECPKHLKHAARELHTWSKCKHPNVLPLLGFGLFRGGIGMVSPWMGKGTLPRYLERTPGVNRCDLCAQICVGLSYLHEIEIIHGDLKGANVLISDDGTPVLTDFGNSLYMDQSMKFTQTTSNKSLTLHWSAPELIAGSSKHMKATDVYALGMTIYEVIAGAIPYEGKNQQQMVVIAVLKWEAPKRPQGIPVGCGDGDKLWDLLVRCWSLEPQRRPNASEVANIMKTINPDGLGPSLLSNAASLPS